MSNSRSAHAARTSPPDRVAETYLQAVRKHLPVVRRVLRAFGSATVGEYVTKHTRTTEDCYENRRDVSKAIADRLRPALGKPLALAAEMAIDRTPVVLTANHHGVDYFAQSVQATLMLARTWRALGAGPNDPITVLACGSVPLNNLVYPRGLTLYGVNDVHHGDFPVRVPIFPDRMKRDMVCTARGFDRKMVARAKAKIQQYVGRGILDETVLATAGEILEQEYREVASRPGLGYSEQAMLLNHRLWRRMFAVGCRAPDLAYLELEKVVTDVLLNDLGRAESLVSIVLFDPQIRESVVKRLDGSTVCWNVGVLASRVRNPDCKERSDSGGGGTMFFWGLDERARRVPLTLTEQGAGPPLLIGVDDRGTETRVELTAIELQKALEQGTLLPSLFLSYLVIALSRGMTCLGGYYQALYLPHIQRAVAQSLATKARYHRAAVLTRMVPTDCYLSGMQVIMWPVGPDHLIPASVVEIASRGGLSVDDLKKIDGVQLVHAHVASLFETVPDAAPWAVSDPGWKRGLAEAIGATLRNELVVLD